MKFSTKRVLNLIKNHSLKGLTQISNVLANKSTLNILKVLYKEGAIQSLAIHPKSVGSFLSLVTINLRVVGGNFSLQNIQLFNPRASSFKLNSIDRLTFKQVTVIVSSSSGISTSFYSKKIRSGGTLLLSF
jgi:ribosomal protein S8